MSKTLNDWKGHTPPKTERLGRIYETNKGSKRPVKNAPNSSYKMDVVPR